MRRKSKNKKKDSPEKEAERKYQNSPTAKRRTKEIEIKTKDSGFKERVDQFNKENPYPGHPTDDEMLECTANGTEPKINIYHKKLEEFCDKEGIDPHWFKIKKEKNKRIENIITLPRPLRITYHQKPKPISKERFLKEGLDFDKIMPVLIKQRYVEEDYTGNYLPSQDFLNGHLIKEFDPKKNLATIAVGLDDEFKAYFPDYYLKDESGVNKFMKIESILKQSFRLMPHLEATAPFNDQDFKDMESFFTLAGIHYLGPQPERRGNKVDPKISQRDKNIYNACIKMMKECPNESKQTIFQWVSVEEAPKGKPFKLKTVERIYYKYDRMFSKKSSA